MLLHGCGLLHLYGKDMVRGREVTAVTTYFVPINRIDRFNN